MNARSHMNRHKVIPILFGFFVMGFVDLVGISTSYVKADFGLSDTLANLLPMTVFVWFALFSIPNGMIMSRFGRRNTVIGGMLLTAAAMALPVFAYGFPSMLVAFALLGIGNTTLHVALNPMATAVVEPRRITSVLTWGQFIKAVSSLLGPISAAAAVMFTGSWLAVFPVYAAVTLLTAVWLRLSVSSHDDGESARSTFSSIIALFGNSYILLCFLGIMAVVGIDVGLNTTIPKLLMHRLPLTLQQAGMGTSLYFAARMAGTFAGAILLTRIAPRPFLLWGCVLGLIAFTILIVGHSMWLLTVAIVLSGLACSNIFPIIFGLALSRCPDASNQVSSLMIMGISGGALITPLMGLITDAAGLIAGFALLPLCLLLITRLALRP